MALLNEVANGECVASGVTGGEALVSHVEEGEGLLLLDDVRYLLPLLGRGVNTSGVVCTSVEKNDGLLRDVLEKSMRISYEEDVIL